MQQGAERGGTKEKGITSQREYNSAGGISAGFEAPGAARRGPLTSRRRSGQVPRARLRGRPGDRSLGRSLGVRYLSVFSVSFAFSHLFLFSFLSFFFSYFFLLSYFYPFFFFIFHLFSLSLFFIFFIFLYLFFLGLWTR